jgi:phosphate transport system permease protein
MAVAFLIGSVMSLPEKITDPTTSIPVLLANNFAEAQDLELSSMYYLALILFVLSFIVIASAKFYFFGRKRHA